MNIETLQTIISELSAEANNIDDDLTESYDREPSIERDWKIGELEARFEEVPWQIRNAISIMRDRR